MPTLWRPGFEVSWMWHPHCNQWMLHGDKFVTLNMLNHIFPDLLMASLIKTSHHAIRTPVGIGVPPHSLGWGINHLHTSNCIWSLRHCDNFWHSTFLLCLRVSSHHWWLHILQLQSWPTHSLLVDQLCPFPFFGLLDLLCCVAFPAGQYRIHHSWSLYSFCDYNIVSLYLVSALGRFFSIRRGRVGAVLFSGAWILLFSSLPYLLFKIVSTVRSRGKNLFSHYSITGVEQRKPASWTERLHVAGEALFGTELWRKQLPWVTDQIWSRLNTRCSLVVRLYG